MTELKKQHRSYGLWDSPLTPGRMAAGANLGAPAWDESGALAWMEWGPGRSAVVIQPPDNQAPYDLNTTLAARGGVGYGGGEFTIGAGWAYFAEAKSGRIYRQPLAGGGAQPLTPAYGAAASPALSPDRRWLLYVHSYEGRDTLAVVDTQGVHWPQKLVQGDDFYMQPAWHPSGDRVAWIAWNHPNMPWDGTFLHLGRIASNNGLPFLQDVVTLVGGAQTAIFQPEFSPDGRFIAYVSDASGWSQLHLYDLESGQEHQLTSVHAEHGVPAWSQGLRTYAFDARAPRLFFLRNQNGFSSLWAFDLNSRNETRLSLDNDYAVLDGITVGFQPDDSATHLAFSASGPSCSKRLLVYRLLAGKTSGRVRVIRRTASEELPEALYSQPQAIAWSGMDGGTVHGLFYLPANPRFESTGKPPLIVNIHGGPTSQARPSFDPQVQFFTSRGYAVLEVNHRGSTGYGRGYMLALRGNWGLHDVQDAVSGARHLAEMDWVDGSHMVISGGSAGGYTVLQTLVAHPGVFKAAICRYGISNQITAAVETHKFEERYNDSLIGALPEAVDIYRERSPLFHAERIQDPIALFQGEDDQVVRRNQSDEIVEALRRRGIPHVYHVYPGEGHGFRKPETIEHYYTAVDAFLKQHVIYA